jgi:hypothetical protein
MSGQQGQQPAADAQEQAAPTPQEIDQALQQEMRREAATREELPDEDQVFDSGNQGGMGPQGAGHGRRSGRHS